MKHTSHPNVTNIVEIVLVVLLLLALLLAVYEVTAAFFGVFTFALIFSVSFVQPFEKLAALFKGRRKLAGVVYAMLLLSFITLPFFFIISSLSNHIKDVTHWVSSIETSGIPDLPHSITDLPEVGAAIKNWWVQLQTDPGHQLEPYKEHLKTVLQHVAHSGAGMLGATGQFIFGIIISAFFLVMGRESLVPLKLTLINLLGSRSGLALIEAVGQAIKGVAIGVMGTGFFAGVIAFIGLMIAGMPFSIGLSALIFFMVVIQVGPMVVWIPLTIWTFYTGHTGMGIFMIVWGVVLIVADGILKPLLISKSGSKMPVLILFIGVLGGMFAWGFTGMFKGAIIMAVFYTIFNSWLKTREFRVLREKNERS